MKKTTILVIDDDAALLASLKFVLQDAGYSVLTADNGEKGLLVLRESVPDMIVMDVKMPQMSGLGFLRQICGANGRPRYPVLVLTAHANMKGFFDNLELDGFMLKPCSVEDLLEAVKKILTKHNKDGHPVAAVWKPMRRRIILAEDDPETAKELSDAFVRAGHSVEVCTNGSDALGKTIVNMPDILVIKAVLAQMNGQAVVTALKGVPKTQDLRILLYDDSGFTTPPDQSTNGKVEIYWFKHGTYCFVPSNKASDLLLGLSALLS